MTSGNRSDEPIAIDNEEALARLDDIADYFLVHDRDILLRCDDSVMRESAGTPQFVRRSRGFVPTPIQLSKQVPSILAVGGELKNTICISRDRYAFPGQHIGDLQELSAYEFFQESIRHFQKVLEVQPEIIAHDLHPGYLSTQWAKLQTGVRLVGVQHHHAHIASCMAEHQLDGPVIGVALDGTGYGTDGAVWGGEVLIADLHSFQKGRPPGLHADAGRREGDFRTMADGHFLLMEYVRCRLAKVPAARDDCHLPGKGIAFVEQLLQAPTPSTLTSSCGRLFDAVAALVCHRTAVSYEAQAAIILEACCGGEIGSEGYPFSIKEGPILQIGTDSLFAAIAEDLCRNVAPATISRRFHKGLAAVLTETVLRTSQQTGVDRVCLSGGTFQNSLLSDELLRRLEGEGLAVFTQSQVPPGDGGLSLGQLIVASDQ
jgi:hydrogenase maturation protein HypF